MLFPCISLFCIVCPDHLVSLRLFLYASWFLVGFSKAYNWCAYRDSLWFLKTSSFKYRRFRRNHYHFHKNRIFKTSVNSDLYCWLTPLKFSLRREYFEMVYIWGPKIPVRIFENLFGLSPLSVYIRNDHVYLHDFSMFIPNILFIVSCSGFIGDRGNVVQNVIDVSTSVNATNFGAPYAAENFRNSYTQSIKCPYNLLDSQRNQLQRELSFPVTFPGGTPITHDHAVMAALRTITRTVFDRCSEIQKTPIKTLVVGSGDRETNFYQSNPNVHYYFHDSDAKDYDRIVNKMLRKIANAVKQRLVSSKTVHLQKRYTQLQTLLNDYALLSKLPECFHTDLSPGYEQLVFEDSFYNFSPSMYHDIFKRTGANVAYGYGVLPLEFLYKDMPDNRLYRLTYTNDNKVALTYPGGYSTGYIHDVDAWSTLLLNPVMNFTDFSLVVEIVSYCGPFAVFKIIRTTKRDTYVRTIALPEHKKYVRVLDMFKSFDASGNPITPYKYFSVYIDEFYTLLNYMLALDKKSLTLENTLTFIRRHGSGISLQTKELMAPWHLPPQYYYKLALSALLYCNAIDQYKDILIEDSDVTVLQRNISGIFRAISRVMFFWAVPVVDLVKWLAYKKMHSHLVLFPDNEVFQRFRVLTYTSTLPEYTLDTHIVADENFSDCVTCTALTGRLGDQVVKCKHKHQVHEFSLTDAELDVIDTELIDDDDDPAGLAAVKKDAKSNMPVAGFSHKARVHFIKGGPGCGKSHIIRQLATTYDMIYSPFTRLRSDYINLKTSAGEKYNLFFQTIHRGMRARNKSVIYVDEWTSMPYQYLAMVVYLCGADDVYFVGDEGQTRVQEPQEGIYIGNRIPCDSEETDLHILERNFRNPADTVALLNSKFDYNMQAMRSVNLDPVLNSETPSIVVLDSNDPWPDLPALTICYSHATCKAQNLSKKSSVRANQGRTTDYVFLPVTTNDTDFIAKDNVHVVALSRHRKTLYIRPDGSPTAQALLHRILPEKFNEWFDLGIYKQFLPVHTSGANLPVQVDMDTTRFVNDNALNPSSSEQDLGGEKEEGEKEGKEKILLGKAEIPSLTTEIPISSSEPLVRLVSSKILPSVVVPYFSRKPARPLTTSSVVLPEFDRSITTASSVLGSINTNSSSSLAVVKGKAPQTLRSVFTHILDVPEGSKFTISTPYGCFSQSSFLKLLTDPSVAGTIDDVLVDTSFSSIYEKFSGSVRYTDHATMFVNATGRSIKLLDNYIEPSLADLPDHRPPKDSFLFASEIISGPSNVDTTTSLNEVESVYVSDTFSTGTLNPEIVCPVNLRGHLVKLAQRYKSVGNGIGLHYANFKPFQTLQVVAGRYFNSKAAKPVDYTSELLARDIVQKFFSEHVDMRPFDNEKIDLILAEFIRAARSKCYEKQFVGFDNPDGRVVRFHLKTIFKPKLLAVPDVFKVGQGISAWSKDAQIMFGAAMRVINDHMLLVFKPHYIYDNKMKPDELKQRISLAMANVPDTARIGVTDFDMFDAQQDKFTQLIEKEFLKTLGVSEDFIELYYSFRAHYMIQSSYLRGRCGYEKTSGEPGTLPLNTALAACLSNYVLRGEGPVMMAGKGDDGMKYQANIAIDPAACAAISGHTKMRIKLAICDEAEFCGFAVTHAGFFENIPRKLNKLVGHRFRDYKHFCEYQNSLRDWVRAVSKTSFSKTVAFNANLYKCSFTEMSTIMDTLISLAHISEAQFELVFSDRLDSAVTVHEGDFGLSIFSC